MKIIIEKKEEDIMATNLIDGQIGVITKWGKFDEYCGEVVQRFGCNLVVIGSDEENGFPDFFIRDCSENEKYRVKILNAGTKLILGE